MSDVADPSLELPMLAQPPAPLERSGRGRSRRLVLAFAGVAVLLAVAGGLLVRSSKDKTPFPIGSSTIDQRRPDGLFASPTGVVLLFADGIDGVTAVDLDRGVVGRRVVEGERPGDQPFRLTHTGDHLVVGWGEIWAAPLDGGPSRKIDDATIYLPAAEPGEVWTLTWAGGRIGQGYEPATRRWELVRIPVGGGLGAIALSPQDSRIFFADNLTEPARCPEWTGHRLCSFRLPR